MKVAGAFMGTESVSTSAFANEVRQGRSLMRDSGRDVERFPIGKRVYLVVPGF